MSLRTGVVLAGAVAAAALTACASNQMSNGSSAVAAANQSCPATTGGELPLKYKAQPTVAAITPCDLMSRLYIFADDSMLGRRIGTPDIVRATKYIGDEMARMGFKPGGDNGTFYQNLPLTLRSLDNEGTTIVANGRTFHGGKDITATVAGVNTWSSNGAAFIYGGVANDTIDMLSADAVKGKILVLHAAPQGARGAGQGQFGGRGGQGAGSPARQAYTAMTRAALATITVVGDQLPVPGGAIGGRATFSDPAQPSGRGGAPANGTPIVAASVTNSVAQAIFGKSIDAVAKGTSANAAMTIKFTEAPAGGRNVVAILEGSDPKLRGEYVALGAHPDHNGYFHNPVDTDSLHAYMAVFRPQGADSRQALPTTPELTQRFRTMLDSIRRLRPVIRLDSIQNGADDDGSGSVSMLEIAQAFASLPKADRPKRSLLFVWNAGEEAGLWGSQYFTNHPTVPRDSIVAQLNMDMVGRGAPSDVTGSAKEGGLLLGGESYLQLVGSRRLSTELGDIVEQVSKSTGANFTFDYGLDADAHPQNIYCRSDHANYARYGIPVTFFTTGGHADYHQVTDEPQYIRYTHMAKIDKLVYDIATTVGNLDHRVVVDKQKPADPFGRCVQ
jgi:hypothetical protein